RVAIKANVTAEKFTATADRLDGPKSALHPLPLRAKDVPPRHERYGVERNNRGIKEKAQRTNQDSRT
ncbi:MAG: hypothetical protein IJ349_03965, partial [Clostridia bacterium]|nr:hypothetical protein [Clostridia bacterium]